MPLPRVVVFCGLADALTVRLDDCLDDLADAVAALSGQGVPVVFCSERTRAELGLAQQRLGVRDPFICEGGAALLVPSGYFPFAVDEARRLTGYDVVEFGAAHADVLEKLRASAARLGLRVVGFADMSVSEVAADRNLPLLQARLAKFREYEELFRLVEPTPDARTRLTKALRAAGLRVSQAGDGYERVSAPVDSSLAVKYLGALFRRAFPGIVSVGLGRMASHLPILAHSDYPILVSTRAGGLPAGLVRELPAAHRVDAEAVVDLVERLAAQRGNRPAGEAAVHARSTPKRS